MASRPRFSRATRLTLVAVSLLAPASAALAYLSQVDGTVIPVTNRMQQCLDRAVTGEGGAGIVDALADARIQPEAYRPVENPVGSGHYPVTFRAIGEGAGYKNSFGWVWTDVDPTNVANLNSVFGCRPGGTCACPCDPTTMRPGTTWINTIDFSTVPGFTPGRAITFWIRTPERTTGGNDPDNCGDVGDTSNRIYFTSKALNDDGDFIHFLVYRSITHLNAFYFGFEDLFRGGDNDFEDILVRADGLVPLCDPQPEVCNGLDDDCDLVIDDGLTRACSTACGAGTEVCTVGTWGMCSARTPTAETCNNVDDDCDTRTDEGLTRACSNMCGTGTEVCTAGAFVDCNAPTPGIESCNGNDDDCDGMIDEMISRACFTTCGSGTEVCTAGTFTGCTAPLPGVETCDNTDQDCDGRTDEGLTRSCANACGAGTETCISGSYVGCTAPVPGLEACNDIDDDCDGNVDEGLTRTCSTACGTGTETCSMGAWVGCDAPTGTPEVCNNVDDDCNGVIDDGNPGGGEQCIPQPDGTYMVVDRTAARGSVHSRHGPVRGRRAALPRIERVDGRDVQLQRRRLRRSDRRGHPLRRRGVHRLRVRVAVHLGGVPLPARPLLRSHPRGSGHGDHRILPAGHVRGRDVHRRGGVRPADGRLREPLRRDHVPGRIHVRARTMRGGQLLRARVSCRAAVSRFCVRGRPVRRHDV